LIGQRIHRDPARPTSERAGRLAPVDALHVDSDLRRSPETGIGTRAIKAARSPGSQSTHSAAADRPPCYGRASAITARVDHRRSILVIRSDGTFFIPQADVMPRARYLSNTATRENQTSHHRRALPDPSTHVFPRCQVADKLTRTNLSTSTTLRESIGFEILPAYDQRAPSRPVRGLFTRCADDGIR
jgi:hypothetical protein